MPTFGPSAQDSDNRGVSTSRLLNFYRQAVPGAARSKAIMKSVLGTETFADVSNVFFWGAGEFDNDLYAAYDGTLYRIGTGGSVNTVGSITAGRTAFSSNSGYLTLTANGTYYTVMGTITAQTINAFTSASDVFYHDQYTLLIEKDGRRVCWSDLADPTTMPALNFRTAESTDDDLLRGVSLNGRVILFKENSREIWYNTEQSGADAFKRVAGGFKSIGLKGVDLLTKTDEALFFIGNDNIARITMDGDYAERLSYPPVDTAIAQGTPTGCFYLEDEGQKFCHIRFSDRPTWVLDLATQEWHERAEGPDHDPWPVLDTVKVGSTFYGFTDAGTVRKFLRSNADASGIMKRTAISETFYFDDGLSLDELQIFLRSGFHTLGRDAQVWIRLSKDGGHTWGIEQWCSIGDVGDFGQKAEWRAMGNFEQLTIELNISEPAEIPIWADYRMKVA